jgi:hypothetical protein
VVKAEIGMPVVYVDLSRNRLPALIASLCGGETGTANLVAFLPPISSSNGLGHSDIQGVVMCRYAPVYAGTVMEANSWHHIFESRELGDIDMDNAYQIAYQLGAALAALSGNTNPSAVDRGALMTIGERFAAIEGVHDLRQGMVYVKGFTEGYTGFEPKLLGAPDYIERELEREAKKRGKEKRAEPSDY